MRTRMSQVIKIKFGPRRLKLDINCAAVGYGTSVRVHGMQTVRRNSFRARERTTCAAALSGSPRDAGGNGRLFYNTKKLCVSSILIKECDP